MINEEEKTEKPFPYNVRRWVPEVDNDKIIQKLKHPHYLTRVVQYNILSDSLLPISTKIVEEDLVKLPHLSWENRSKKILSELKTLDADLITLIELERDENFMKELNNYGYEVAFKPRTGNHSEGCAIAWKNEKYELIDLLSIGFNINKNENNISDIYNRDNIGIIGILKLIEIPDSIILLGTMHTVFNVRRGDIKLGQLYQFTNCLEELRKKYEDELKNKVYVIFGTDLNSIPKSSVYKFLTTGQLNCNQINKVFISGQDLDNLEKVDVPTKIRSYIYRCITANYSDKPKIQKNKNISNYQDNKNNNIINNNNTMENLPVYENIKWFNEICRIKPVIENHCINLEYDADYKYNDFELFLKIPFTFKSAYAMMAKSCLEYFNNKYNGIPFNCIENLDEIKINELNMGKKEIEKANNYVKNQTLENPFSYYSNDTVMSLDYIFYYSKSDDIKVVKILNIPDMHKLFFDIGYMPNEIYPSDHLSLAADLVLGGEK